MNNFPMEETIEAKEMFYWLVWDIFHINTIYSLARSP
jgi:hypothetical protein